MPPYFILLLLLLTGCNRSPLPHGSGPPDPATTYKVIRIKDGDTFVLMMNKREQVIRFAHIDCPEKKQPFGNRALQFVSDRCFGKYVSLLHHHQYDRNKRLIAEVLLEDGRNLNKELVRNGLAWHFKKYSCDTEYAALEAIARQQRKGLWANEAPIAPWNWRHRQKEHHIQMTNACD